MVSISLTNANLSQGSVKLAAGQDVNGKGIKFYKNKPNRFMGLFRKTIEAQVGEETVYLNQRSCKNYLKRINVSSKGGITVGLIAHFGGHYTVGTKKEKPAKEKIVKVKTEKPVKPAKVEKKTEKEPANEDNFQKNPHFQDQANKGYNPLFGQEQ